jgi:hypothetical protein
MGIHDSKLQTNAKVWSNLIFNLESKAKIITCGRIWYGGHILAVGNKNSQLKHQSPKISQISPVTQWHNYAHFWYSKIDLDGLEYARKIAFSEGGYPAKQQDRDSLNCA